MKGIIVGLALVAMVLGQDSPCVERKFSSTSFVCVCNSTYCDDIAQMENPGPGKYILYSSDRDKLRFHKTEGNLVPRSSSIGNNWLGSILGRTYDLVVNTAESFQDLLGFGGSVTDAACINYYKLSEPTRKRIIRSYFGKEGIEYNMIRTPIGGSDFSDHPYAYNENHRHDLNLTHFALTDEDIECKIPMLKEAIEAATDEVLIKSAVWSPPGWMKTNGQIGGYSRLLPGYYRTYALYHLKYLEEYKKRGINMWAISTGNEPSLGLIPWSTFNCLGWDADKQADWIVNHLGPMLRSSEFAHLKLFTIDDQRFKVPLWIRAMKEAQPTVMDYIDGIALHFYWDKIVPSSVLDVTVAENPGKILLGTEACTGSNFYQSEKVSLGNWGRSEEYIENILENLNKGYTGWIDWNLALDEQGGPNWFENFVDAPIITLPQSDEFLKQPLFYAMGHFSKFLPRGSTRIAVDVSRSIAQVAFSTPDGRVVVVCYNGRRVTVDVTVIVGEQKVTVTATPYSVHTINIWPSA